MLHNFLFPPAPVLLLHDLLRWNSVLVQDRLTRNQSLRIINTAHSACPKSVQGAEFCQNPDIVSSAREFFRDDVEGVWRPLRPDHRFGY